MRASGLSRDFTAVAFVAFAPERSMNLVCWRSPILAARQRLLAAQVRSAFWRW